MKKYISELIPEMKG